jgi:hypothetical protein
MHQILPDGLYPFYNQRFPLHQMAMVEAPPELEEFILRNARIHGIEILRDLPIELRCRNGSFDATFLIWWPESDPHIHLLVPKSDVHGTA